MAEHSAYKRVLGQTSAQGKKQVGPSQQQASLMTPLQPQSGHKDFLNFTLNQHQ